MLSFASATPLAYSGSAFAMPRVAPSMGLGFPSPKELAGDPKIEDVLRIAKTEQVARFARIAAQEALGGFQPGGAALMREMPGAGPFGYFDPWSLTPEDISEARRYREAELIHGRVSMMAALGFLVQENFHPMFGADQGVDGPVIRQLDQTLSTSMGLSGGSFLLLVIMFSELYRARTGWMEPSIAMSTLRPEYTPGSLGFDPLKLRPTEPAAFEAMQNKELNNGRLAMIGVAGMTAQELVSGSTLFD